MSKGALTGRRTLTTMTAKYANTYTTKWDAASGWFGQGAKTLVSETYIDLSANTLDDLTLVPRGPFLQDPGMYLHNKPGPFVVVDIISQERLDLNAVVAVLDVQSVPGMPESNIEPIQILFGNLRVMNSNTTVPGPAANLLFLTSRSSQFGSGEPTAVEKLWCYRILHWVVSPVAGDTLEVPAGRFVIPSEIIAEKELSYLMRMKRSYELA